MNKSDKIFVTGHRGLVGSALIRLLKARGHDHVIVVPRTEVDLTDPVATKWFFSCHEPHYVFHCAARVGGIKDNALNPVSFFLDNINIQTNVLVNAAEYKVKKLLFLGSSCIYPVDCPRPMEESSLFTGPLEPAVEAYGMAKLAGLKLCQFYRQEKGCNFVSALPCNLYGINDCFDAQVSHVIPGLLARMSAARRTKGPFKVWGDGTARREVLFSDDLAEALYLIMEKYEDSEPINAGSGYELSVKEIAEACAHVLDFRAKLTFDPLSPTGTRSKPLDNCKLFALGWRPKTAFSDGLRVVCNDFRRRNRNRTADQWRLAHPERAAAIKKAYREKHPDVVKAYNLKNYWKNREDELARHRLMKYGLTSDGYAHLIYSQKGKCAICETAMQSPQVDHCHESAQIRGLLCGSCNKFLGLAHDDPARLRKAADYLEKSRR